MASYIFRAAFKNRWLAATGIAGLAMGLAAAIFLLSYFTFELSYDKHYPKIDRIYRALTVWISNGETPDYHSICLRSIKPRLEAIPEVERVAQLYDLGNPMATKSNGEKLELGRTFMVDSIFLSIFDAKRVYGKVDLSSLAPGKVVLVRSEAERLLGKGDPVGKTIEMAKQNFTISAVVEDPPLNTMLRYKALVGEVGGYFDMFGGLEFRTFVLFKEGVNTDAAIKKCNAVNKEELSKKFSDSKDTFDGLMEPFSKAHYASKSLYDLGRVADYKILLFLLVVVLFVLGVAITNYINISIIRGEERAKEISIRKANGADRWMVVLMLLKESAVIVSVAFVLAFALLYLLGDYITSFLDIRMPEHFVVQPIFYPWIIGLFILTVAVSSLYPALYLSKCSPMELQRNSVKRRHRLTLSSVVLQFTAVVFCLVSLTVVGCQIHYFKNLPLGYDVNGVYTVVLPERVDYSKAAAIVDDLQKSPIVISASASDHFPFWGCSGQGLRKAGDKDVTEVSERRCDANYFSTYKMKLLEGRVFSQNIKADSASVILSKKAVSEFNLDHPVGAQMLLNDRPVKVVGVVDNIHWGSAEGGVSVDIYDIGWDGFLQVSVRVNPKTGEAGKKHIEQVLKRHFPMTPIKIGTASDYVKDSYNSEQGVFNIIASGAVMAIILALIGLIALSRFVAKQKEREVAVRKTLGASVADVVSVITRYVLIRILPAIPIGAVLAYYVMQRWLSSFVYRIDIEWWMFAAAIVLTLILAFVVVIGQTLKTACINPVSVLRKE